MSVHIAHADWTELAAGVLGIPPDDVRRHASTAPFLSMGGTSLRATAFAALVERGLGRRLDLHALLGPQPLAEVIASAPPAPRAQPAPQPCAVDASMRLPGAGQEAMIFGEQAFGGTQFHLLFSAEIAGPLDEARLLEAIAAVTDRHEALRTVFVSDRGELRLRVLSAWRPRIMRVPPPPEADTTAVEAVHRLLAASSAALLRPMEQPPVLFAITSVLPRMSVLSVLIHHAIADGWSIGMLWRDLLEAYEHGAFPTPAHSPDLIVAAESAPAVCEAIQTRQAELAGVPLRVEIPGDLPRPEVFDRRGARLRFGLGEAARDGCERLARACGVTRNVVLLGAWGLAVSRRAGMTDMLIGVSSAGRTNADLHDVFGLCTKLMPVRVRGRRENTVRTYLEGVGIEFRRGLAAGSAPLEVLGGRLRPPRDPSRSALIQIGFAAHDELVPAEIAAGALALTLHEGHCGGTAFDAILFVERWGAEPRLNLEHATSVVGPAEASALASEVEACLAAMAADFDAPLAAVSTLPPTAQDELSRLGAGTAVDAEADIWRLVASVCEATPEADAVRDGDGRTLTYRQLRDAVHAQSAALSRAGVGPGDSVALVCDRGVREIVAVLATLRLGAAYVALDMSAPPGVLSQILDLVAPRALLATGHHAGELAALAPEMTPAELPDPWTAQGDAALALEADPTVDPGEVAYIAFTSGTTGVPKGVRIPHRAVVRLVRDPALLAPGATDRFMRFAPLAFDASTLEIFAPLVSGGCVETFPDSHATPSLLADFLLTRRVTGAWLTAGLFRLVADDRPDAFSGMRHLLTGGDVVPARQARRVLATCPGLRLSNGYGPSENTTFTTTYDADSEWEVGDPMPIGRPIAGTDVLVADDDGRPLPRGAVGELWTTGSGLAVDYLRAPEETARAFVAGPDERRYYRTGDLVRWTGDGNLAFIGRRDLQIKVRGFRVELGAVTDVLRGHPMVLDAVVVASGDAGDRQIVAGVVPAAGGIGVAELQAYAGKRLPAYAVPVLWAIVDELPLSRNGKVDAQRLTEAARANIGAAIGRS